MNDYIETDERLDVICSLQIVVMALGEVRSNSGLWKWVILGLHNAFQAAMVCHLTDTAGLGAFKYSDEQRWLEWYKNTENVEGIEDEDEPRLHVAPPRELFKRVFEISSRIDNETTILLEADKNEKNAFELLCNLRNEFAHFRPKGWSLEISGLPEMSCQILKMILEISENGWAFRHLNEYEKTELMSLIENLKMELLNIQNRVQEGS